MATMTPVMRFRRALVIFAATIALVAGAFAVVTVVDSDEATAAGPRVACFSGLTASTYPGWSSYSVRQCFEQLADWHWPNPYPYHGFVKSWTAWNTGTVNVQGAGTICQWPNNYCRSVSARGYWG